MKILGISFSPREQGNTEILLEQALTSAKSLGADTELLRIADTNIKPCDGCSACFKTGQCHVHDDMEVVSRKLLESDGIIFGSPVYYYNITAQGKIVIDRSLPLGVSNGLANKVGGIIVVGGSLGLVDAVKDLYFYMVVHQMIPANFVAAYASMKGDVKKLGKCMKSAEELGIQMVKIAEKKFTYPEEIRASHIGFGTHTW
jgi:multimeric flavodoxin WrbA